MFYTVVKENRDSFEEEEATIAAVSRKYKKYDVLSQKVDLQKVSEVFIFLDNHPNHINVHLFKWCKDRGIYNVTLPPNCTHVLQMTDTSIFGPAKLGRKNEDYNWKRENGCKEVNEIEFIKIL